MKFKWLNDVPYVDGGNLLNVEFVHNPTGAEVEHGGKTSTRPTCTAILQKWDSVLGWRDCFSATVVQNHKDRFSKPLAEKYAFLKLLSLGGHLFRQHISGLSPETDLDNEVGFNVDYFNEFRRQIMERFFTPKRRRILSAEGRRKKK